MVDTGTSTSGLAPYPPHRQAACHRPCGACRRQVPDLHGVERPQRARAPAGQRDTSGPGTSPVEFRPWREVIRSPCAERSGDTRIVIVGLPNSAASSRRPPALWHSGTARSCATAAPTMASHRISHPGLPKLRIDRRTRASSLGRERVITPMRTLSAPFRRTAHHPGAAERPMRRLSTWVTEFGQVEGCGSDSFDELGWCGRQAAPARTRPSPCRIVAYGPTITSLARAGRSDSGRKRCARDEGAYETRCGSSTSSVSSTRKCGDDRCAGRRRRCGKAADQRAARGVRACGSTIAWRQPQPGPRGGRAGRVRLRTGPASGLLTIYR